MINLATVEKRLEILDQEVAAQQGGETVIPAIGDPQPEDGALPTTTSPCPSEASCATTPAWQAKTLRGKKRQRERYRRARAVLQAKHAANRRRRKDKRKKELSIRVAPGG